MSPIEAMNALKDPRHNLYRSIFEPAKEGELLVVRCDCCERLCTEPEIYFYGCCPVCKKTKFHGGYPNVFERVRLWWFMFWHSWRVDLEKARSVVRSKEKKLLASMKGAQS